MKRITRRLAFPAAAVAVVAVAFIALMPAAWSQVVTNRFTNVLARGFLRVGIGGTPAATVQGGDLYVRDQVEVDCATTGPTYTNGCVDVDVASSTANVEGVNIALAASGAAIDGLSAVNATVAQGTDNRTGGIVAVYRGSASNTTTDTGGRYFVFTQDAPTGLEAASDVGALLCLGGTNVDSCVAGLDTAMTISQINTAGGGEDINITGAAAVAASGGSGSQIVLTGGAGDGAGTVGRVQMGTNTELQLARPACATMPTCALAREGSLVACAGSDTVSDTRLCLCGFDDTTSNAYEWMRVFPTAALTGSATACP